MCPAQAFCFLFYFVEIYNVRTGEERILVEVLYHLSTLIFINFCMRQNLPKFFKHIPASAA